MQHVYFAAKKLIFVVCIIVMPYNSTDIAANIYLSEKITIMSIYAFRYELRNSQNAQSVFNINPCITQHAKCD